MQDRNRDFAVRCGMRHVIIGTSAAGIQAAETLRRYAPDSSITLISDEEHLPYSRPLLTYLLSGEVPQQRVWLREPEYFRQWGFDPQLGEAVTRIAPLDRKVHLATGGVVPYDRLLIASGARPRLLGIPGEDLPGVFTLRTLTDWQRLNAGLSGCREVVVVGAGAVGLKAADALTHRGLRVSLLEMASRPLPRLLDHTAGALLQRALTDLGVELHCQRAPAAILGQHGRVRGVALTDGRELPAQAVLVAVGVTPNVELLAATGLAEPGGVVVDHHLGTADPHIYAAGDCIQPYHLLTGERTAYPIWPAAAAQGRVAGANLAGASLRYDGLLPQNSISLRGFQMITGGLGPHETEDGEVVAELDERRGHYRRLVFREGRLVGLTLVGAVEDAGIYFQLMAQQLPTHQLAADPRAADFHPGRLWG